MNMFKPTKAKTVEEYIEQLPPERKEIIDAVEKLIEEVAPELKRHFAYNMLGYGSFKYRNYKHEPIDWPVISVASQKNYVSVYVCSVNNGKYVAEQYAKKLGKVSVGKSCIRFKKLQDVNLDVLKEVIATAAKNPGLTRPEE